MARTPEISDDAYERLVAFVREIGYDTDRLRKVPHSWRDS